MTKANPNVSKKMRKKSLVAVDKGETEFFFETLGLTSAINSEIPHTYSKIEILLSGSLSLPVI